MENQLSSHAAPSSGPPADFNVDLLNTYNDQDLEKDETVYLPQLFYRSPNYISAHLEATAIEYGTCASYRVRNAKVLKVSWSNFRWTSQSKGLDGAYHDWWAESDESLLCLTADKRRILLQGVVKFRLRLNYDSRGSLILDKPNSFISWSVSTTVSNPNWGYKVDSAESLLNAEAWYLQASIKTPQNTKIKSCEVYYTSDHVAMPRYVVYPNQWQFRDCQLTQQSGSQWRVGARLDIPSTHYLTHARVTEIVLILEDGSRVILAPPRRQELNAQESIVYGPRSIQMQVRDCARNEKNCFGYLEFIFPKELKLRHLQVATASFHSDFSNADKWFAPFVDLSLRSEAAIGSDFMIKESSQTKHLFWRISLDDVDSSVRVLAVLSYRLIFDDFTSASSGSNTQLPVISR